MVDKGKPKVKVVPEETRIIRFLTELDKENRPRYEFFCDQFGNPSTSIKGVVYNVDSTQFKDDASYNYFIEKDKIFNKTNWEKALSYIKTIAKRNTSYCPMRCYVKTEEIKELCRLMKIETITISKREAKEGLGRW